MFKPLVVLCVLALLHAPTVRCQDVEQTSAAVESEGTLSTDDFVTTRDDVTIIVTDDVTSPLPDVMSAVTDDGTSEVTYDTSAVTDVVTSEVTYDTSAVTDVVTSEVTYETSAVTDDVTSEVTYETRAVTDDVTSEVTYDTSAVTDVVTSEVTYDTSAVTDVVTSEVTYDTSAVTDVVTSEVTTDTTAVPDVTSPGVNTVAACDDRDKNCLLLGYSICTVYVSWAAMYCARSCDLCNGVPVEVTLHSSDYPDFTSAISTSSTVEESSATMESTQTTTTTEQTPTTATTEQTPTTTTEPTVVTVTEPTTAGPLIPNCCKDQLGWEECKNHRLESCQGIYRPWAGANCQAFCGFCQPCPIEPCEDTNPYCSQYGKESCTSESYFIWAITNCRKTCNLCIDYGFYYKLNPNVTIPTMSPDQPAVVDTTRTAQTVATATTAATPTGGQCADLISHCSEYGKNDCGTYSDFMSHYCPRYCGNCTPDSGAETTSEQTELSTTSSTECGDRLQNCTHYLEEYCCGIYEPWAKHNCASYCGFCGVPPPRKCTDSIEYCDREPDDLCTNPNYRLFRMENCAGFCKLCDTPWVPPSCAAHLYNVSTTVTVPETTSSN